jgi:hypothetical protein
MITIKFGLRIEPPRKKAKLQVLGAGKAGHRVRISPDQS